MINEYHNPTEGSWEEKNYENSIVTRCCQAKDKKTCSWMLQPTQWTHFSQDISSNSKTFYVYARFKQIRIMQIRTRFPTVGKKLQIRRKSRLKINPMVLDWNLSYHYKCMVFYICMTGGHMVSLLAPPSEGGLEVVPPQ